MKKQKRRPAVEAAAPPARKWMWWPWAAAAAALLVILEIYGPALRGAFVFDDRLLPFMDPVLQGARLGRWIGTNRPLLMLSFWIDYQQNGAEPLAYHLTNIVLHLFNSVLISFIAAKFLAWAGTDGVKRDLLAAFAGGLFLLHPLQTESVAYVASRSETLSVFLFLSAFAVFLYRAEGRIAWWRAMTVIVLFAGALVTKEHTAILPALILLTDLFWAPKRMRDNVRLYALLLVSGIAGGMMVWRVLASSQSAGFAVAGLGPAAYFFTQCRVVWTYIRMFFVPAGQNVDADVPISHSLLDHGALIGLIGIAAVVCAAWIYRKRWPLAAFGTFVFFLLVAPTSSVIPIEDVQAERRVYLPFIGLALVTLEILRRAAKQQILGIGAAILLVCSILTYHRAEVWSSPESLWRDSVAKSPRKMRPHFQLAYALYETKQCPAAADEYGLAAQFAATNYELLSDWALALDCAGRVQDAIAKMQEAASIENTAHAHAVLGSLYAKSGDSVKALEELAVAETLDASFEITYVYRGIIFERAGDRAAAEREYRRALKINPSNQAAREGLRRMSGRVNR